MRKLLSANFMRLWQAKEFWLCVIAMLLISATSIYSSANTAAAMMAQGIERTLEDYYFQLTPYLGAIMAVFISLFLGTEYSDGTIRNKLIVGHSRTHIFLANFLVCFSGSLIITAAWLIGGLPGLFLIGPFEMGLSGFMVYCLLAVGITASFTAIFVWISTLPRNRAFTVVLVLALWVGMVLVGSGLNDRLMEPEFNGGMAYIDGQFVMMEDTPNPMYLEGKLRLACIWLRELLPAGQAILMTDTLVDNPVRALTASLMVTAAAMICGILCFRKKDLR